MHLSLVWLGSQLFKTFAATDKFLAKLTPPSQKKTFSSNTGMFMFLYLWKKVASKTKNAMKNKLYLFPMYVNKNSEIFLINCKPKYSIHLSTEDEEQDISMYSKLMVKVSIYKYRPISTKST